MRSAGMLTVGQVDPVPREWLPNMTRIAAGRAAARRRFQPEIAAVLVEELEVWAEFGYRLGGKDRIEHLIDALLEGE